MSPDRRSPSIRRPVVVVLAVALTGLGAGALASTTAAWSDPVVVTAQASVSTWPTTTTLGSCTVTDATGTAVPGTPCSVATTTLIEQGGLTPGDLLREYQIAFSTRALAPDEQITFDVDLTSPEVTSGAAVPNPDWSWAQASTVATPSMNVTPVPGYACTQLPQLVATVPQGSVGPALVTVLDHRTAAETCT